MLVKIKYICVACGPIIIGPTTLRVVDWGFMTMSPHQIWPYIFPVTFLPIEKKKKTKVDISV